MPRSLTQMLRDLDDAALRDLFMARPDLTVPAPTSFSQVASRATTRESVRRALDSLNALDLWVAKQASTIPDAVAASDITGVGQDAAAPALGKLRGLGLLWGDADALRAVRALAAELTRSPLHEAPSLEPPRFEDVARAEAGRVDAVAAGSAFELVRRVDVLAEHTDHTALRLRQDGGLAQRESRVVGSLLDVPVAVALLHTQVAQAAGLVGVMPQGRTDTLVPTAGFDEWRVLPLAEQWAWLARGWRDAHPPSGSAGLKALCFEAFGPPAERRVLGPAEMHRWLAWQLPRIADDASRRATTLLTQAAWIGVTGLGALATYGLGGDLTTLRRLLPERADTVLVQNDLTAVASGPLTPSVARELSALADVESRGGATVYRFTVESLRRAHSLGWSSSEITAVLSARSRTPIPQPLSYLIADLDRAGVVGFVTPTAGPTRSVEHHQSPVRADVTPLAGSTTEPTVDADAAAALVVGLRHAASPTTAHAPGELTAAEGMSDSPLDTLREAVETGEVVWVGYVDTQGGTGERLVYASAVEDGRLLAKDSRTSERLNVPVHRITVAHIIRGGSV